MTQIGEVGKILIVDDNPTNVRLIEVYLRNTGYATEKAFDGEEALQKIRDTHPDLVLLDVMMPKLDGYEVCKRLRADEATSVIPVIMITALTGVEDRIRGLDAGADDFLSKPFDRSELLARVRNLLRVKYYRSMIAERQKFDAVIEDLSYGILVTDGALTTTVVNKQAQLLLGLAGQDCRGRDIFELLKGFRVRPEPALLRTASEHAVTLELEQETDGPAVYLRGRLTRIFDPAAKLANMAFVFRDVTEERLREKLMYDFVALVSHKLKTPLTIVSGYVNLINSGKYGEMNPDLGKTMGLVGSSVEDLKLLIEKLLQYADLLAEEIRHEAVRVDLPGVIDRCAARVVERYGAEHVELERDLPADLPLLLVDVEQLAIVLDNLIDNAVKFADAPRARIRLRAARLDGQWVEIAVQDFGPGIPYKHQSDVFADFRQVDESFTGNVRGLGLGLPIVKRLVESWGGRIELESRPPAGATFTFTVPAAPAAPAQPPSPQRPGGPRHMETA